MRTIIAGSRTIRGLDEVTAAIENAPFEVTEVFSGCAKGPDTLAVAWANLAGVPVRFFPANWDKFGKSADAIRNREMVEAGAEALIAVWDGQSPGTQEMIDVAELNDLTFHVHRLGQAPAAPRAKTSAGVCAMKNPEAKRGAQGGMPLSELHQKFLVSNQVPLTSIHAGTTAFPQFRFRRRGGGRRRGRGAGSARRWRCRRLCSRLTLLCLGLLPELLFLCFRSEESLLHEQLASILSDAEPNHSCQHTHEDKFPHTLHNLPEPARLYLFGKAPRAFSIKTSQGDPAKSTLRQTHLPKSFMNNVLAADLFCGAGGTSQGLIEAAHDEGREMNLTAVNHCP